MSHYRQVRFAGRSTGSPGGARSRCRRDPVLHKSILMLLVLALVAAACGGAGDDGPDDAASASDDEQSDDGSDGDETEKSDEGEAASGDAACEGSSITLGTNGDANNYNPILAVDSDGWWRTDLMFSPLVLIDPESGEAVPHLATSWEISDDGLSYTFSLDERATFQDGEPLTAEDVEFTLMQMLDPDYTGAYRAYWARLAGAEAVIAGDATELDGIEVVDDHTITLTLEEPYAGFLTVAVRELKPLPKHLLEGEEITTSSSFSAEPVGSGMYKFVSYEAGNRFEVEAWDEYWGDAPACMQSVVQEVIPDQNTLQQGLFAGQLDASIVVPPSGMDAMRADDRLEAYDVTPRFAEALWFNVRQEPWADNPTLRRAIAAAIDWMTFQKEFMYVEEPIPGSFLSYGSWAYDEEAGAVQQYDPELAAELFAEAGYPDGGGLEFTVITNAGNEFREAEQVYMQEQLAAFGVTVNIETAEWGTFIEAVRAGNYDVAAVNQQTGIPDPTNLDFMVTTDGPTNYSGYSNPRMDELMAEAGAELDNDRRIELYREMQEILAEDLPWIPTIWYPNNLVIDKKFQNVDPSVNHALWNIQDLAIAE